MRSSLLVKVVLMLAATGLLPLTISFYQLKVNKKALLDELLTTHAVMARTTAARVTAYLQPLRSTAHALGQTAVHQSADSTALQELLYGVLQTQNIAVKVFNSEGGEVLRAQRSGIWEDLELAYDANAPAVGFVRGREKRWLRVVEALPEDAGQVVVIADPAELEEALLAAEVGSEADLVLVDDAGEVLLGALPDLSTIPEMAVERALSGKLRSSAERYEGPEFGEDLVVAHARTDPWTVMSRQSAIKAQEARRKILQASLFGALIALVLTAFLSLLSYTNVIRPMRRLVRAQQDLVGTDLAGGSEIAQLEAAFELLEQRVRDQEELGRIALGRYQVVDILGEGAMGTVFKGWDPKLERLLAIKTIRLESDELRREKLVSTLLREAKTSAGFNHPNIVTVYDAADQGKAAFIAMEFVDGITLEDFIASQGSLDWHRTVPVGIAIARGLAAAHDHQLVHQDIKPANILLGRDDSIKVTDFGISQAITSASVSDGVICGTPGFIAPECLEGAGFSPQSDLFALGVVLYECLTGRHPFAGKTLRITILNTLNQAPAPLEGLVEGDLPPELEKLVFELLEKNPARRPASAEAVEEVLERLAVAHGLSWTFQPRPVAKPAPSPRTAPRTQLFSIRPTQRLDRVAQDRAAPDRVAPDRVEPDRVAPDRVAQDRVAQDRAALDEATREIP